MILSNKLAIAISDGCANAKGERLFSLSGFSRLILYQKALEIAEFSLEVNHSNAILLQQRSPLELAQLL
ncbi:MAG: hypothetical protein V7L29_25365 [Nostoc sp.]|uniref:hypothetical protein n=1 Tax=Nostoc sp. TaxID=1180 RepID=UPI002FFC891B